MLATFEALHRLTYKEDHLGFCTVYRCYSYLTTVRHSVRARSSLERPSSSITTTTSRLQAAAAALAYTEGDTVPL